MKIFLTVIDLLSKILFHISNTSLNFVALNVTWVPSVLFLFKIIDSSHVEVTFYYNYFTIWCWGMFMCGYMSYICTDIRESEKLGSLKTPINLEFSFIGSYLSSNSQNATTHRIDKSKNHEFWSSAIITNTHIYTQKFDCLLLAFIVIWRIRNIMKWSIKWPNGNVLSRHTFFLWPYMVSWGALQWPLNIRWRWCTRMCHWLCDINLSSNVQLLSLVQASHKKAINSVNKRYFKTIHQCTECSAWETIKTIV